MHRSTLALLVALVCIICVVERVHAYGELACKTGVPPPLPVVEPLPQPLVVHTLCQQYSGYTITFKNATDTFCNHPMVQWAPDDYCDAFVGLNSVIVDSQGVGTVSVTPPPFIRRPYNGTLRLSIDGGIRWVDAGPFVMVPKANGFVVDSISVPDTLAFPQQQITVVINYTDPSIQNRFYTVNTKVLNFNDQIYPHGLTVDTPSPGQATFSFTLGDDFFKQASLKLSPARLGISTNCFDWDDHDAHGNPLDLPLARVSNTAQITGFQPNPVTAWNSSVEVTIKGKNFIPKQFPMLQSMNVQVNMSQNTVQGFIKCDFNSASLNAKIINDQTAVFTLDSSGSGCSDVPLTVAVSNNGGYDWSNKAVLPIADAPNTASIHSFWPTKVPMNEQTDITVVGTGFKAVGRTLAFQVNDQSAAFNAHVCNDSVAVITFTYAQVPTSTLYVTNRAQNQLLGSKGLLGKYSSTNWATAPFNITFVPTKLKSWTADWMPAHPNNITHLLPYVVIPLADTSQGLDVNVVGGHPPFRFSVLHKGFNHTLDPNNPYYSYSVMQGTFTISLKCNRARMDGTMVFQVDDTSGNTARFSVNLNTSSVHCKRPTYSKVVSLPHMPMAAGRVADHPLKWDTFRDRKDLTFAGINPLYMSFVAYFRDYRTSYTKWGMFLSMSSFTERSYDAVATNPNVYHGNNDINVPLAPVGTYNLSLVDVSSCTIVDIPTPVTVSFNDDGIVEHLLQVLAAGIVGLLVVIYVHCVRNREHLVPREQKESGIDVATVPSVRQTLKNVFTRMWTTTHRELMQHADPEQRARLSLDRRMLRTMAGLTVLSLALLIFYVAIGRNVPNLSVLTAANILDDLQDDATALTVAWIVVTLSVLGLYMLCWVLWHGSRRTRAERDEYGHYQLLVVRNISPLLTYGQARSALEHLTSIPVLDAKVVFHDGVESTLIEQPDDDMVGFHAMTITMLWDKETADHMKQFVVPLSSARRWVRAMWGGSRGSSSDEDSSVEAEQQNVLMASQGGVAVDTSSWTFFLAGSEDELLLPSLQIGPLERFLRKLLVAVIIFIVGILLFLTVFVIDVYGEVDTFLITNKENSLTSQAANMANMKGLGQASAKGISAIAVFINFAVLPVLSRVLSNFEGHLTHSSRERSILQKRSGGIFLFGIISPLLVAVFLAFIRTLSAGMFIAGVARTEYANALTSAGRTFGEVLTHFFVTYLLSAIMLSPVSTLLQPGILFRTRVRKKSLSSAAVLRQQTLTNHVDRMHAVSLSLMMGAMVPLVVPMALLFLAVRNVLDRFMLCYPTYWTYTYCGAEQDNTELQEHESGLTDANDGEQDDYNDEDDDEDDDEPHSQSVRTVESSSRRLRTMRATPKLLNNRITRSSVTMLLFAAAVVPIVFALMVFVNNFNLFSLLSGAPGSQVNVGAEQLSAFLYFALVLLCISVMRFLWRTFFRVRIV